jgi:hypothetical protein
MGWKKLIFGEKMPDKDDPKNKEQREKENKAGRNVAKALRLDKVAAKTQHFALIHPKLFLLIVFGFVIGCLGYNIYGMFRAYHYQQETSTAVERQQERLYRKGVFGKPDTLEDAFYQKQQSLIEGQIDALTAKGEQMTHEDSLQVKLLLKQLVQINNLKKETHDN